MYKFNTILFDLDGTLIDSTPLILESFKYTLKNCFNETKCENELIKYLGIPLRESFQDMYPGKEDLLISIYRDYNERIHDSSCAVFNGINSVLSDLKCKGITLGVVTSKRRELAFRGMKLFGLEVFMSVFIGPEDTLKHKPDGEPILKALEILSVREKDTVLYVGDSSYDILCAKSAGVKSAAVAWSYMPKNELLACNPDYFLETPKDLLLQIL